MTRVLVISHGHPAFSIGGAEVASYALFRALNATTGIEAFFLSRAAPPMRRHAATPLMNLRQGEREVFFHTDSWDEFWLSNGGLADLEGAFADYLEHVRPDVVHFHHVIGLGLEAIVQVRRQMPTTRVVITFHEYLPICANHGQMVKTGRGTLCHAASPAACSGCFPQRTPAEMFGRERHIKDHLLLADAFVSPSRFLAERFIAWGMPAERFHVVENGLEGTPVPMRPLSPGGRRDRFGFFGQITEFKGLHILLDAVGRVPDAVWGDATLNVFGGNLEFQPDSFRTHFAALMERAGRRARFHGPYRPEDLPRLMAGVDWTVVPSIWWENSPVVIQEAFLHRRPPITNDIGGMAEKVTDGIDGLHFRVGSPEDLADRLTQALLEPGICDRLAAAAPRPPNLADFARLHLGIYGGTPATPAQDRPKPPSRPRPQPSRRAA